MEVGKQVAEISIVGSLCEFKCSGILEKFLKFTGQPSA
jgi:hypothetical protein